MVSDYEKGMNDAFQGIPPRKGSPEYLMGHSHGTPDSPKPDSPERPTVKERCVENGHQYHGNHNGLGRCYCGRYLYPMDNEYKPEQLEILQSALGLDRSDRSYRNYYHAPDDTEKHNECKKLCAIGCLTKVDDGMFKVTEMGEEILVSNTAISWDAFPERDEP